MKYRYKQTDIIVESGIKLDSAIFTLVTDEKATAVTSSNAPAKKTAGRRKTTK